MILLVADDLSLVRRWSEGVRHAGGEYRVADKAVLKAGADPDAGTCVVDLGARSGGDLSPLLDAIPRSPQVRFVALTANPTAEEGLRLLRAGARAYCNRLASPAVAAAVLAAVDGGEIWAGRQVTDHLLAQAMGAAAAGRQSLRPVLFEGMTQREVEIAEQVAAGHSNKMIAAGAGISERTVKTHLNNIFRKTGVVNRVQLALAINAAERVPGRLSSG